MTSAQHLRVWTITAQQPTRLTKSYHLDAAGTLTKREGSLYLSRGHVAPVDLDGLDGFAAHLASLSTAQALTYGGPDGERRVLTDRDWNEAGRPSDAVARIRDHFAFERRPGVMMLDYDPDGETVLDRDELVAAVRAAAPGLAGSPMLWLPSSSSYLHRSDTGERLTGLRGQRLYIAVQDATDIPRAGATLVDRLWHAGHGRVEVSKSGQKLERTAVDASVFQPERLDFAAGAACEDPVEQHRGSPVRIEGDGPELVDTTTAIPELDETERKAVEAEKRRAKAAADPHSRAVKAAWIEERAGELTTDHDDDAQASRARRCAQRAVEDGVLTGDFTVLVRQDGADKVVTVGELLDRKASWHRVVCRDPLEPDYRGGVLCGIVYTLGGQPCLYSQAHGGRRYTLIRQPARVQITGGRRSQVVDDTLSCLAEDPAFYDFGDALVHMSGGDAFRLDGPVVDYYVGRSLQFYKTRKASKEHRDQTGEAWIEVDEDVPGPVRDQLLGLKKRRGLKPLRDVVTAPTLRPDGTVIDQPGYDPASGIFYHGPEGLSVPTHPTSEQAADAVKRLLRPFRRFPFETPADTGGLLAALITAAVRPALKTCPAFGMDASAWGSGKTLLAQCIGALRTGRVPAAMPTVEDNEEEVRKRLYSAALAGEQFILWDNVLGQFNSASLASYATSETVSDRILGGNSHMAVPWNAMVVISGNNLCLTGDLPRRVVKVRIVPDVEVPASREFNFDPLAMTLRNRRDMVVAALTLVRYRLTAKTTTSGTVGSFEDWNRLVRQTVQVIGRDIAPDIGDPLELIENTQQASPEAQADGDLMEALRDRFGDMRFTAKDVVQSVRGWQTDISNHERNEALGEALRAIVGERPNLSLRTVGRVLHYRSDRIAAGRRLRKGKKGSQGTLWHVEAVEPPG